jgi:hypothetical protein
MIWVMQDVEAVLQNAVCLMDQAKNIQLQINGCKQYILQYWLCYVTHTTVKCHRLCMCQRNIEA